MVHRLDHKHKHLFPIKYMFEFSKPACLSKALGSFKGSSGACVKSPGKPYYNLRVVIIVFVCAINSS